MQIKSMLILVFVVALLVGMPAQAQKAEIFGGFSVQSAEVFDREAFLGVQTSLSVNLTENWGIVADFGRQWRTVTEPFTGLDLPVTTTQYLFGPRYIVRGEKTSGFIHALFGGGHVSAPVLAVSENAFMMGFGGGLDVDVGRFLAIRFIQFDWLPSRNLGVWSTEAVRFGFGIVLKGLDE
jgi:hypothetical protein